MPHESTFAGPGEGAFAFDAATARATALPAFHVHFGKRRPSARAPLPFPASSLTYAMPMRQLCVLLVLLVAGAGCAATDGVVGQSAGKPVFDVPALLGKNIDEVRADLLGAAITPDADLTPKQLQSGQTEWIKSFRRDSTTLVVSYNAQTRRVHDFFLKTAHGRTSDYQALLRLANVTEADRRLRVEPMKTVANPRQYVGIRLAPR
jgi:hypothetical protein